MILRKILLGLVLAALCGSSVYAQTLDWNDNFNTKIPDFANVTYIDLVKKIFPDARVSEKYAGNAFASKSISLRHLFGKPNGKIEGGNFSIEIRGAMKTVNANEKLLWLILSAMAEKDENCMNCGNRVLAAFRVKDGAAEMIDAAEIQTEDQSVFWEEKQKIEIAPHQEAVIIHNFTQLSVGAESYSLVSINQKGFNVILNQFALQRDMQCGYGFEEGLRFKLVKTTVGNYRNIEMKVTTASYYEEDEETESSKPVKPKFSRSFRYLFVWKPLEQKYKAVTNLEQFQKQRHAIYKKLKPRTV